MSGVLVPAWRDSTFARSRTSSPRPRNEPVGIRASVPIYQEGESLRKPDSNLSGAIEGLTFGTASVTLAGDGRFFATRAAGKSVVSFG